MIIELKYLGRIEEVMGSSSAQLEMDAMTVAELKSSLFQNFPNLKKESFKIAVNQELVKEDFLIGMDCEIALLPPFAGG